jgi:hypothetical protein
MMLSLLCFTLAVICCSIKDLQAHGKLKWMDYGRGFWGEESYYRKYADPIENSKNNWYTKFFKIKYKERWFTSTTFTVFLTDAWHLLQFLIFIFLSLGISLALELHNWQQYLAVYAGIHVVHFLTYRLLQR